MSRIGAILVRLFVMLVGYGFAALTASVFLHLIAWPAIGMEFEQAPWELMGGLFFSIPLIGLFIASLAFFPSLALLAAAEYFSLRSWLYYAFAGGAAALAAFAIAWSGMGAFHAIDLGAPDDRPLIAEPAVLLYGIASGMVGALAYWVIAGRGAGRWLQDRNFETA